MIIYDADDSEDDYYMRTYKPIYFFHVFTEKDISGGILCLNAIQTSVGKGEIKFLLFHFVFNTYAFLCILLLFLLNF